jgi:hypothetical protein
MTIRIIDGLLRLGVMTLKPHAVKLEVSFDTQAHVFIGVSKDIPGLIVESTTVQDVIIEANRLLPHLLVG